jgi:hypothetical protein
MPGGISTRKFFRVDLGDRSAVAMVLPAGEVAGSLPHSARSHAPYLEVRALLQDRGVRVPRLLGEAGAVVLVEDLGDDTLDAVVRRDPDRRDALYAQAVADLARAQERLDPLPDGCIVRTRSFDEKLLRWELDHFREFGLEARGIQVPASLGAVFDRIARAVAGLPQGFVHRDYQSRNLMLVGGDLVWIDFQDALLGPRAYDLVALLADSYQILPEHFVASRLAEFARLRKIDLEDLGREYHLIVVQRKLKDAGRFVFFDRTKGDASYLPYVDPTLAIVRTSLRHLPDLSRELQGIPGLGQ